MKLVGFEIRNYLEKLNVRQGFFSNSNFISITKGKWVWQTEIAWLDLLLVIETKKTPPQELAIKACAKIRLFFSIDFHLDIELGYQKSHFNKPFFGRVSTLSCISSNIRIKTLWSTLVVYYLGLQNKSIEVPTTPDPQSELALYLVNLQSSWSSTHNGSTNGSIPDGSRNSITYSKTSHYFFQEKLKKFPRRRGWKYSAAFAFLQSLDMHSRVVLLAVVTKYSTTIGFSAIILSQ